MKDADQGSRIENMQWNTKLPFPNVKDWTFLSTPYSGSYNSNGMFSVYALAYTGGITYIWSTAENDRQQRPALYHPPVLHAR